MIICCHPDNARVIRKEIASKSEAVSSFAFGDRCGIRIIENPVLEKERPKPGGWVKHHFPQDPFVEYEERDLDWMVPLGLAWTEREMEMVFYCMSSQSTMLSPMPLPELPKSRGIIAVNMPPISSSGLSFKAML